MHLNDGVSIVLLNFVTLSSCARILCVFPTPSLSHQIVFRPLVQELARIGHRVYVATPNPTQSNLTNLTEISFEFSHTMWSKEMDKLSKSKPNSHFELIRNFVRICYKLLDEQLSCDAFRKVWNEEKFDLLIVEYLAYPALFVLKHKLNIPMIGISSMDTTIIGHDHMGNLDYFWYPENHLGDTLIPSTIWEGLRSMYGKLVFRYIYNMELLVGQNNLVEKYISEDFVKLWDADLSVDLLLVNANPALGFSRPVVPTYVDITGIHITPPKPLDEEVRLLLDSSKAGVILFSLGSNVKSELLPDHVLASFLQAFAEIPYTVLWKTTCLERVPKNVRTFEWIEQNDVLAHPNVKLFIFQGGYQSMVEAVTHGVPMIGIPFFGDQILNSQRIAYLNVGESLNLNRINKDSLRDMVYKIIEDPKYKSNVIRLSKQLYDTPQTSLERSVWWTEYILRHNGSAHLRPVASHLPNLGLVLFLSSWLIASICVACTCVRCAMLAGREVLRNKSKAD